MSRMDEQLAVADLLMLAIVADRRVSEAEIAALGSLHEDEEIGEAAGSALGSFLQRVPVHGDPAAFDRVARAAVPRASAVARRDVYRAVISLARQRSGILVQTHYRALPMADRAALLIRFRTLLALPEEECRALEAE